MSKRLLTVALASLWLLLATVGLFRYGWTKWTTIDTARFPNTMFCRQSIYLTFGGRCEVPSDVAWGLLVSITALLLLALILAVSRARGRRKRPTQVFTERAES